MSTPAQEPTAAREERFRALPEEQPAPRAHRIPDCAFTIDGEAHDGSVIRELDGRVIHFAADLDAHGEPVLRAFTSRDLLTDHLRDHPLVPSAFEETGTSNPDSLSPVSRYFEHHELGGDVLSNNPDRAWSDLTRVRRGFLGTGDWNDLISSVDWCRWDVSLFEHVNFGGSELYLRAGRTYGHLAALGWNDRASSTVNWGFRR